MNWRNLIKNKPLLFVLVFLLTFGIGTLIGKQFTHQSIQTAISGGKQINVLVMGIDSRSAEENSRSDTMILASIDGKNKKAALIWIPRDTRVEVKSGHYDKINSVNYVYGPERACEVVSDLLDTPVDHYVVTNFRGFAKIIDILGGLDFYVESNMYHWDPNPELQINLSKGQQHFTGKDALAYVRFRGVPTADIGRTGIQQKFVKALAEEMLQGKTILKLPQLIPEIVKNIHTNIPMDDMAYMVKMAADFDTQSLITQTLPGYSFTDPKNGASYWQADEKIADGIVEALFAGETFEVAQAKPSWVNKPAVQAQPPASEAVVEQTPEDQTSDGVIPEELPDGTGLPLEEGSKSPDLSGDGYIEPQAGTESTPVPGQPTPGAAEQTPTEPAQPQTPTPPASGENTNTGNQTPVL
ncbi:MAG: LCP family protein [Syntrophomonadaceae bacterium]|nr:LCP family protein [Syntrophomonadaceae bacterium]